MNKLFVSFPFDLIMFSMDHFQAKKESIPDGLLQHP